MRHLGERITDFVFGEMPAEEMAEATRHLKECNECSLEVQQFERTHAFLKTSADVEPPRQIIFEVEKPRFAWKWSWLVPSAVAAALLLVAFIAAPIQTQWHDSQLTIVFGRALPSPASAPAAMQPIAEKVDYQKIETLVSSELEKRDGVQKEQIQQLQGELDYWKNVVQQTQLANVAMAGDLQTLSQRTSGSKDSGGGSN